MRMCHFWDQNGPFVMNNFFGVQTIIITSIYLLALFTVQNLKKFLQQIQSYEGAPFLGPIWSICPNFFFRKILNIILIYLLAPFITQNYKKILPADPELRGCAIFGPKMAHFSKQEFFSENLLRSLVSFIYAYLNARSSYVWQPNFLRKTPIGQKWPKNMVYIWTF